MACVSFDALFKLVLFHEHSHARGPAKVIMNDGEKVPVNRLLGELGSPIDEAKADLGGLYRAFKLIDDEALPKESEKEFCTTYLARLIGDVRHGLKEAHAKGRAAIYNYLKEREAVYYDENSGRFGANFNVFRGAAMELLSELVNLQAEGNYVKAKKFMDSYGHLAVEVEKILPNLNDIPIDINPTYRQ